MKKIFVMGSLNMDVSIETDIFPQEGETIIGRNFMTNPGGKGANQAVAASKQGGNVIMLGAVGNDLYGRELIENLEKNKVETKYIKTLDTSTGVAVIILNEGKNRIIIDSGANFQYKYEDFCDVLKKEANPQDIFLVQFETNPDCVHKGLALASELGMKIVVNPAPARKIPLDIYKKIDIIIPNECEAQSLTGIKPENGESFNAIINKLIELGIKHPVVTLGKLGSVYFEEGMKYYPIIDSKVVDTTGAGDAFIGALVVELSQGKTYREAIAYATACSALTVSRYGAQKAIPTRAEVEKFLTNRT